MRRIFRFGLATGAALALALAGTAAWAGGSGLDEQDDADAGTPFFGFVKAAPAAATLIVEDLLDRD